jgi:hypothetical protein
MDDQNVAPQKSSSRFDLSILDPERQLAAGLGSRAQALPGVDAASNDEAIAKAVNKAHPDLGPLIQQKAKYANYESEAANIEAQGQQVLQQAQRKLENARLKQRAVSDQALSDEFAKAETSAPELHPTRDNVQTLAGLFSLIGVIGTVMGGQGRMSALSSLKSMSGMMGGWQQGRKDLWDKELKEFDKATLDYKNRLDAAYRKYSMGREKMQRDYEAGKADMDEALAELGSPFLKATRDKQGYEMAFKHLESAVKDAQHVATEAGAERRHQETLAAQKELAGLKAVEKVDREIVDEVQKHYPGVQVENLTGLSKEGVARVNNSLDTIKQIESVAKYVSEHPQAVGATAKIKNYINLDAIKGLTGDAETVAAGKAAIIDNQIDDAVKRGVIRVDEAESAKVLNKMLFSTALSDVRSSGQRGSVYLDRAFQGLYDQASRPGTLISVLDQRIKESDRRLEVVDLDINKRNDTNNFPLTMNGRDGWMSQHFPVLSLNQARQAISNGTLKTGDWFYGNDGQLHQAP